MSKKKILIVTEYFYPEEFKINDVAIEWKNKGYEVDVLTMVPTYPASKVFDGYKNKWYQKDIWNGINIYRVRAVTGYKTSLFKKLLKYFAFMILGSFISLRIGRRYNLIFGFNVGALTGMVPAILLNKLYNKNVTLWIQDIWPDSVYAFGFKKSKLLEFILNKFVRFVYKHTTSFAISGKGFASRVLPYIQDNQNIVYCPNWPDDIDMNISSFKFSEEKRVQFTFAGNVGKVQNLENIIKVFSSLPKTYQVKSQLNIIGDGSSLEMMKKISKNMNIIFHGRKPRKEMSKYYKGSDFLIFSLVDKSIFSLTVPAKVQTYIASKKPILAIINGDASKLIKDNNLGYVSSPDDLDNIKNIFIKAINASEEEKKIFMTSCEFLIENTFNKKIIIDDLLNLMESKK